VSISDIPRAMSGAKSFGVKLPNCVERRSLTYSDQRGVRL
jgi:hypothetical protein